MSSSIGPPASRLPCSNGRTWSVAKTSGRAGTWLGISEYGIVAGLLNRRAPNGGNPDARSRGLLCLDALRRRTRRKPREFAARERGSDYNPFNLLMVSRTEAFVAYNRGASIEVVALKPGLHLLTNLDVDDFECPKIARRTASSRNSAIAPISSAIRSDSAPRWRRSWPITIRSSIRESAPGRPNALCLHLDNYGTRSSSLIFMRGDPPEIAHYFAPGPPCRTAYALAMVPRAPSAA